MNPTCTTCSKPITADVVDRFGGACPWCLSQFVKPEVETPAPIRRNDFDAPIRPGKPVRQLAPDTPAELASIIERCLAFDPAKRYPNMAEISADLRRYRKGKAVEAHSKGLAYRTWKLLARRKLTAAFIVGAVLMSSAVVILEFKRLDVSKQHEAEMWTMLGEERLNRNDCAGAREAFTRAIEIRPTAKAYLDRNFASWRLHDFRACLEDAERALDLEPGNEAARRTLTVIETAMARDPESYPIY